MPVPSSASTNSPATTRQPSRPGGARGREQVVEGPVVVEPHQRLARESVPDRPRPRRRPTPPGRRPRCRRRRRPSRRPRRRTRGRGRRRHRCWTGGSRASWSRPPARARTGRPVRGRRAGVPAAAPSSVSGKRTIGRLVLDRPVDVGLAELVAGQGGPTPRAVRHHLDVLVEQTLVPEALQVPPDRLHVLGREGPVGGVDVDPEADPLGEGLPLVHVVADRLPAQPGELADAHLLLDLALVGDAQLALDLDLDRQAVGVPPGPPGHGIAPHGAVAAEQVLVDPGPHVVEARAPVGRRRPLVEHPGLGPGTELDRALEDTVGRPPGQLVGLEGGEIGFGGHRAEQRVRPFGRWGGLGRLVGRVRAERLGGVEEILRAPRVHN